MSLIVEVGTSRQEIVTLRISRRGRDHSTDPDSVHTYAVNKVNPYTGAEVSHGHITHRYGDKAELLASNALLRSMGVIRDEGYDETA